MREGWKYDVLSELVIVINGLWKGKKEPFINVGVIRNANFNKDITLNYSNIEYLDVEERQYKTRKLLSGDLIVEKSGGSEKQPVGRTVLFRGEGEFSVSNFTSILRIKDQNVIIPEFLYKYLLFVYYSGVTKAMQKATTGIHNILFDKFLAIQIPIPSIVEQERIVSLLDLEFAKIDAIKANAEKQLQDAKDLFQSALKDLLTPKEGWEKCKLVEEFDLKSGDYLPSKEQQGGCVPVYGGNGIAGYHNIFNLSGEQIIIGRVGALCGNIHYTIGDIWVTDNAFIVKGISTEWNMGYLKYVLEYLNLNQYATQSAQPVISNKSMKEVSLFKPSINEQIIIFRKLEQIQSRCLQLELNMRQTISLCNDLKQSILKDIFG